MIGRLKGLLDEKSPGEVLVDVGGVGYQAAIPLTTFYRLPEAGQAVDLFVSTNLRENALELFAFSDRKDRDLFNLLRSVSGIGPRLALTVLSGVEAPELFEIMNTEDHARLVSIPGIGRKTAERMIVELKDKMGKVDAAASAGADGAGPERDAVLALVSLGYSRKDSEAAVKQVRGEGDGALEGIIRRSLAKLS